MLKGEDANQALLNNKKPDINKSDYIGKSNYT